MAAFGRRLAVGLLSLAACLPLPAWGGEVVHFYHLDALGSVRAVSDAAGVVVERHDFLPFGEEWCGGQTRCAAAVSGQPRRFAGQQRDGETGLDDAGARDLRTTLGRFTSVDPVHSWQDSLTDPQRWNRYAYVRNNPLRYADPDGRRIVLAPGASETFQAEFTRTITYLNDHGAAGVIAKLESRPEVVLIQEGVGLSDVYYDPSTATITYNPYSAIRTSSGGSQSPAMGFLHEADHALRHVTKPDRFQQDIATPDAQYDTREERRVIRGTETNSARKLGEDTRDDHGGAEYRVAHSDSREPEPAGGP